MTVQRIPEPRYLGGDSWADWWAIPCQDCGELNGFTAGRARLVADLWICDDRVIDACACCGMPLPDERDTATTLWALRKVAA